MNDLVAVLEESQRRGFLGPRDLLPHIEHARHFGDHLDTGSRVLDLGSGGGLPGLVLAVHRPDLVLTLLDAREIRVAFLLWAVEQLGVRAEVVSGRAEELAHRPDLRGAFDSVVVRSFGPPAVTAECAVGFVVDGGTIVVSEPPESTADRWPAAGLAQLGLVVEQRLTEPTRRIVLRRNAPLADSYPRRVGVPDKRPLFADVP